MEAATNAFAFGYGMLLQPPRECYVTSIQGPDEVKQSVLARQNHAWSHPHSLRSDAFAPRQGLVGAGLKRRSTSWAVFAFGLRLSSSLLRAAAEVLWVLETSALEGEVGMVERSTSSTNGQQHEPLPSLV